MQSSLTKYVTINFFMDDTEGIAFDIPVHVTVSEVAGDWHNEKQTDINAVIDYKDLTDAIQRFADFMKQDVINHVETEVIDNL